MKPVNVEVPFATPWFEVLAKTMREGEAPYYSLRLPDYVSVVALTEDGRVLIVRQHRPAVEHDTLELPSGLVDPGETPQETARRELLEETGYQADEVELLGGMETDVGRLGNRIFTCIARNVRRVEGAPAGRRHRSTRLVPRRARRGPCRRPFQSRPARGSRPDRHGERRPPPARPVGKASDQSEAICLQDSPEKCLIRRVGE